MYLTMFSTYLYVVMNSVGLEIPERLRQLPVEKRNLEYVVDCISRVIGVTITIPLAFSKAAGV